MYRGLIDSQTVACLVHGHIRVKCSSPFHSFDIHIMPPCDHALLALTPSDHAKTVAYRRATSRQLLAAAHPPGKPSKDTPKPSSSTFPAPLVLPGDELSWDPEYEPQDLKSWIDEPHRNEVTDERRTLYVVPVPAVSKSVGFVDGWAKPSKKNEDLRVDVPRADDVVQYLRAFYHGLPVKLLSKPKIQFVPWDDGSSDSTATSRYIGLNIGTEIVRIRSRASKDKVFSGQLNLNDLLDAAIAMLPREAYALLMLVEHDLYEDEEDDFCCGRAFGGSRVSVVSMARYNPALDESQEVEKEHAWPASHCQTYVDERCRDAGETAPARKRAKKTASEDSSPLHEAVLAWNSLPSPTTSSQLRKLWLGRLCKTASHELGHCFGMDHCVYYACIMQGTAGLSEDARQPPYLCPVDMAKVLGATGADEATWVKSMSKFCERFSDDRMFLALFAWLDGRLQEIGSVDA